MLDSNYDINTNTKAYYKLNGNSNDSSGNGNNGTDTDITYVDGKFGQCASFNGSTSGILTGATTDITDNGSVFAMIRTSKTTEQYIALKETPSAARYFGTGQTSSKLNVFLYGTTPAGRHISNKSVCDGLRHHVGFTYNGSSLTIYIDGLVDKTISVTGSMPNTSIPIKIGNRGTTGFFDGLIDEVIIENRAWTSQEVLNYYNKSQTRYFGEYLGAGPDITKGLYHLNGNSNDSSGNGNNGTDTAISYVNGRFGQAGSFNGSSSYIDLPAGARLSGGNFTISAWINLSAVSGDYHIHSDWSFAQRSFLFAVSAGQLLAIIGNGLQASGANMFGGSISIGNWYHCMLVCNGTTHKLYLNGKEVATQTGFYQGATTTNPLLIGVFSDRSGGWYDGLIDEVIIENRAWTSEEIKKYYTYAKGRFI